MLSRLSKHMAQNGALALAVAGLLSFGLESTARALPGMVFPTGGVHPFAPGGSMSMGAPRMGTGMLTGFAPNQNCPQCRMLRASGAPTLTPTAATNMLNVASIVSPLRRRVAPLTGGFPGARTTNRNFLAMNTARGPVNSPIRMAAPTAPLPAAFTPPRNDGAVAIPAPPGLPAAPDFKTSYWTYQTGPINSADAPWRNLYYPFNTAIPEPYATQIFFNPGLAQLQTGNVLIRN